MGLTTETRTIALPNSAGFYWWRESRNQPWKIMTITGAIGEGWGLTVDVNTHTKTVLDVGGQWGPQIEPPQKNDPLDFVV